MSFIVAEGHQADRWADEGSSLAGLKAKKEEVEEEDFTFDEPCQKKQKTSGASLAQPTALPSSKAQALRNDLNMNWDLIEVLYRLLVCFMCGESLCLSFCQMLEAVQHVTVPVLHWQTHNAEMCGQFEGDPMGNPLPQQVVGQTQQVFLHCRFFLC